MYLRYAVLIVAFLTVERLNILGLTAWESGS